MSVPHSLEVSPTDGAREEYRDPRDYALARWRVVTGRTWVCGAVVVAGVRGLFGREVARVEFAVSGLLRKGFSLDVNPFPTGGVAQLVRATAS